jgi:hypothetical protein
MLHYCTFPSVKYYHCSGTFLQVFVIPPSRIEFVESVVEAEIGTILQLPVALYGRLGKFKHINVCHFLKLC